MSSLRSPLREAAGNASRKKDFRFPTKEQRGFQIETAEQCSALEAEHGSTGTPSLGAELKELEQVISLILYGTK